jgi:DNA-binding response OmpR family regulator
MGVGKRVLVVDDEEGLLNLLKSALEIRGFEVITACSAIEAGIEIAGKIPDIILMDINMPGIDGLQASESIRRNPALDDIPLIIMSARSDDAIIKKACKIGIAEYFVKPVNIEKLVAKLKEVLDIK